ncbi:carboxymuconolactone decarboxylase family protein [Tistrella bauzanensis]|uniref:Carboxymuconolactone decarboxylase family protein n=1 Tax=Tistrella arctica TaxID=3133430 RepID=A0ABU9YIB9_9PROT
MTDLPQPPAARVLIDIHGSSATSRAVGKLVRAGRDLHDNAILPAPLPHLIDLHVSRLNDCGYCKRLHAAEATAAGAPPALIAAMGDPSAVALVDDAALVAALNWAEALTLPRDEAALDEPRARLARHWSPDAQAAITLHVPSPCMWLWPMPGTGWAVAAGRSWTQADPSSSR